TTDDGYLVRPPLELGAPIPAPVLEVFSHPRLRVYPHTLYAESMLIGPPDEMEFM
ncbi:hypothetical protein KIPB_009428, partial [Kipferlia bialata]